MAAAPPLLNTPKRLSDDSVDHDTSASKRRAVSLGQPESEIDSDEEASLDVYIDKSGYYWDHKDGTFFELMEVSSVIINDLKLDVNQLYGDIRIYGDWSCEPVLFHREKSSDDITVFTNGRDETELLLTDPGMSILMDADRLKVCMEFTNGVNKKTYKCGVPFWKHGERTEYTYYDRIISATMSHKAFGSITMNYTVFQTALAAKVEVLLLDTDTSINDVYGCIYAYNSQHDVETCLFHKTKKPPCGIGGTPGNVRHIPLSRAIVALPHDADLMFSLDLTDSKTGDSIVKAYDLVLAPPPKLTEPRKVKSTGMRFPKFVDLSSTVPPKIQIKVAWASRFAEGETDTIDVYEQ